MRNSQTLRLRPGAASCARRLLLFAVLLAAVGAALFSDFLLTTREWISGSAPEASSTASVRAEARRLPPAVALKQGQMVIVRQDFESDSSQPIHLKAGWRGRVLQVDGDGDAEILFAGQGREWIYRANFFNIATLGLASGSPLKQPHVAETVGEGQAAEVEGAAPRPGVAAAAPAEARNAAQELAVDAVGGKLAVYLEGKECWAQVTDVGRPATPEECEQLVLEVPECGKFFMFSRSRPDWQCRCCAPGGGETGGPTYDVWAIYQVRPGKKASEKEKLAEEGGGYNPKIAKSHHECDIQAFNFGFVATVEKCDAMTAAKEECGAHFMFSTLRPDWACRCCSSDGASDGPANDKWDVYEVRAALPESRKARPPAAELDPLAGLPVVTPKPSWLLKDDGLIFDGRPNPEQGGGILILTVVLLDSRRGWGKRTGARPRWLRATLAANREHARKHGHAFIVRGRATEPQLTPWQTAQCGKNSKIQCRQDNERENYNWEKHLMLSEYLNGPQKFAYVMMLDADACFIRQDHDTMKLITDLMAKNNKDLFLTDEDWLQYGAGRINGGLIVAKNTEFTRNLFQDTFDAHLTGPKPLRKGRIGVENLMCSSNEQICLNDLWKGGRGPFFAEFTMMEGGKKWNHGAEIGGFDEPEVEILHFMGGAKGTADKVLCDGSRDVTGDGPKGYGCKM